MQSVLQFVLGHRDMQHNGGGRGSPIKQCFVKNFPIGFSKLLFIPEPNQC